LISGVFCGDGISGAALSSGKNSSLTTEVGTLGIFFGGSGAYPLHPHHHTEVGGRVGAAGGGVGTCGGSGGVGIVVSIEKMVNVVARGFCRSRLLLRSITRAVYVSSTKASILSVKSPFASLVVKCSIVLLSTIHTGLLGRVFPTKVTEGIFITSYHVGESSDIKYCGFGIKVISIFSL